MTIQNDQCLIDGLYWMRQLRRKAARPAPPFILTGRAGTEAAVVRTAFPHWNPDNLRAALLYSVGGGWSADILLRNAPNRQPIVLGRGKGQPFATRRAAETFLGDFVTTLTATWAAEQVLPPKAPAKAASLNPRPRAEAHPSCVLSPQPAVAC